MEHPKNDSFVVLSGYFDRTKSLAETGQKAAFRVRQRYTVGLVPCIAVFISSERLPKAWKNHEMKDKIPKRRLYRRIRPAAIAAFEEAGIAFGRWVCYSYSGNSESFCAVGG